MARNPANENFYIVGRYHCGAQYAQGWHEFTESFDSLDDAKAAFVAPMNPYQCRTYLYAVSPTERKQLKMRKRRK